MRLLKTLTIITIILFLISCGFFDSDDLNDKYIDGNISIELNAGKSNEPGNIEITSSIEDTILLQSVNINECLFEYYSIDGMKYSEELEKWIEGEINISCDLFVPPLILLPMESKSIEIIPILPENEYTMHMYYSVDHSPDFEPFTEVRLGLRIND